MTDTAVYIDGFGRWLRMSGAFVACCSGLMLAIVVGGLLQHIGEFEVSGTLWLILACTFGMFLTGICAFVVGGRRVVQVDWFQGIIRPTPRHEPVAMRAIQTVDEPSLPYSRVDLTYRDASGTRRLELSCKPFFCRRELARLAERLRKAARLI